MRFLTAFLNKPFPFISSAKQKWLASILFGVFIYLFLLVFQPFEISLVKVSIAYYVIGFGLITTGVMLIAFFVAPFIFKKYFNLDFWNIGKNIIFILGIVFLISTFNWLYNTYFGSDLTAQHGFFKFVVITIAVGFTPIVFLIYFIESSLNKSNNTIAQNVNAQIHNLPPNSGQKFILISGENKNENLEIDLHQLICVKSEGNYVQVFYKPGNDIKKVLIRNSISNIETQLSDFENVYRCHRSYLVNLENVFEVTGNARNFNLLIKDLGFSIPVSRSFPKSILESIV